jgi:membrane-associated protease RseP (regulator of RpoE activity)
VTWQRAPRFQHSYGRHIVLFLVTLATTTVSGAFAYAGFQESLGLLDRTSIFSPVFLVHGLWYSVPVLLILGAHEFGHYALCRFHNVDATLPYFIPAPPFLLITGTLGAVIRIREAFPSKRVLFDIGVAGPIAGFVALVPLLYWGISLSQLVPVSHGDGMIYFGEPLLYKAMAHLHFGPIPAGYDVSIHPMAFAAWWGMLATALNLMPFGQLDGGHVVYSLVGRRAAMVSVATLAAAAVLTTRSLSWISMMVMMVVMAVFLGLHHPRVIDEDTPLDPSRRMVAILALVMFALCFTPVPIQTFFTK